MARIAWVCAVASDSVWDRVAREKSAKRNRRVTVRQTRRAARSRRASRSASPTRRRPGRSVSAVRARARAGPRSSADGARPDAPRIAVVGEGVEMAAPPPAQDRDERRLSELRDLADGHQGPVRAASRR